MGFETPARDWFSGPLADWIGDLLHSQKFINRGFAHPQHAQAAFDRMRRQTDDHRAFALWPWVHSEMWAQTFLDPATPQPVSLPALASR
jgi:hypothetical protein